MVAPVKSVWNSRGVRRRGTTLSHLRTDSWVVLGKVRRKRPSSTRFTHKVLHRHLGRRSRHHFDDDDGVLLTRTCAAACNLPRVLTNIYIYLRLAVLICLELSVCCRTGRYQTAAGHVCTSHRARSRSSGGEKDRQSRLFPDKSVSRKLEWWHAVSRGHLGCCKP